MSVVINTNINALNAKTALGTANMQQSQAMQQLSTGLRINSAADDAAGLAITNRMTSQVNGFSVAIRNSNDGVALAQTAEGGMNQITTMLQRIRDLAVQAATGTMTNADRANSQLEVNELKTQIQQIATQTNLNGINLLDGSAGNIKLQVGTYAGQMMSVGFDSMQTKDIGLGSRASLSSTGGLVDTTGATNANNALQDGSLILNGVSVGASLSGSDNLSSTDNASSAIAKAAAINAVSAQSGVFATVGKTEVAGTNGMSTTAGQTTVLDINGVTTSKIQLTGNNELDRTAITQAINAISSQTGVTASNSHDDNLGISLTAADGRNVDVESGDGTAITGLGLAAAGVYVGTYELNTKDGSSISVSSTVARVEDAQQASGLSFGSYAPNVAQVVSRTRATANGTAAPTSADAGVLNGDTLMINGVGIEAANGNDDTASYGTLTQKAASAISIAAAINSASKLTGVTATAQANVIAGNGFTAGEVTAVTLNGVAITTNIGTGSTRDDVLSQLNAYTGPV
jgi:flagellin